MRYRIIIEPNFNKCDSIYVQYYCNYSSFIDMILYFQHGGNWSYVMEAMSYQGKERKLFINVDTAKTYIDLDISKSKFEKEKETKIIDYP